MSVVIPPLTYLAKLPNGAAAYPNYGVITVPLVDQVHRIVVVAGQGLRFAAAFID
jgi:hypothetical protein